MAVMSASFFKLGFSLPLHPFFVEILDYFELAPMQLTPNSFRVAAGMFILYSDHLNARLSARELNHFYQLKEAGRKVGVFYLNAWNNKVCKCLKGNKRGMYDWLELFLYCYECDEVRKEFNMSPSK